MSTIHCLWVINNIYYCFVLMHFYEMPIVFCFLFCEHLVDIIIFSKIGLNFAYYDSVNYSIQVNTIPSEIVPLFYWIYQILLAFSCFSLQIVLAMALQQTKTVIHSGSNCG